MKLARAYFWIGAVGIALIAAGCRKQPIEIMPSTEEQVIQEETNKFLDEQGIKLAEGAQRAYLSGQLGSRGVATKEFTEKTVNYAIVASLPEMGAKTYQGFISDGDSYKSLGVLREDKGGYVVEKTLQAEGLENYTRVIVSQGAGNSSPSAEVFLTGQFTQ